MHSSDYYTHNESIRSNTFPYVKVFIYENWKNPYPTSNTNLNDNYTNRYSNPYGSLKRLEVTDFIINVGNINQQGNSDIIQNFTGSSSSSLTIIRSIEFKTELTNDDVADIDINFDLQQNDNKNIFKILNYEFDGSLADFEIEVGFSDSPNTTTSIFLLNTVPTNEKIFRGKVSNIRPTETTLEIDLVDGMFEAVNTQALVGEQISNEKITYHDRFFMDDENESSDRNLSQIYGGWDLNQVKKETEFNLKNLPVIPPQRDSLESTVKVKIQRDDPSILAVLKVMKDDVPEYTNRVKNLIYDGNYVEKTGQGDYFDFKNFAVDFDKGLLNFEIPPIRDPEGYLVADYKCAYRYKHPAFLAEKLFNQLGYEKDNNGDFLNIEKKEIDPNYPAGSPDTEDLSHKVKSYLGQVSPMNNGKNEGIKTIHYCETDKLYYYYSNNAVWRTDLGSFNEKLFGTTYEIMQIDSIYLKDYDNTVNEVVSDKILRLIMSYKVPNRFLFAPPPMKAIGTALPGNDGSREAIITPMKDYVSNLDDTELWKEDFTFSIGFRDLDGATTSSTHETLYFYNENWIWKKEWDNTEKEYKQEVKLIKVPTKFKIDVNYSINHDNDGGTDNYEDDDTIIFEPTNFTRLLYKTSPYASGSAWENEIDKHKIHNDLVLANEVAPNKPGFPVDYLESYSLFSDAFLKNSTHKYLMLWSDGFKLGKTADLNLMTYDKTNSNDKDTFEFKINDRSETKKEYIFFIRTTDEVDPKFKDSSYDSETDTLTIEAVVWDSALDTRDTDMHGRDDQEPNYAHLLNNFHEKKDSDLLPTEPFVTPNNGNLLNGIRRINFYNIKDSNYTKIEEPTFSKTTWANQIHLGQNDATITTNNEQMVGMGVGVGHENWWGSTQYEYPYFLGNELTTNFVLHKGSYDVNLVAICARTYQKYDEFWNTDDPPELTTRQQYIYLTHFRVSGHQWEGGLNFIINHPHIAQDVGNDDHTILSNSSIMYKNNEIFFGLNFSHDAIMLASNGFGILPQDAENNYYNKRKHITALDSFRIMGSHNAEFSRTRTSAKSFKGVDICIDNNDIYTLAGDVITKWGLSAEIENLNRRWDEDLDMWRDDIDTDNNILERDTTWSNGEGYGNTTNQNPFPEVYTGSTGRLMMKSWQTNGGVLAGGTVYDSNEMVNATNPPRPTYLTSTYWQPDFLDDNVSLKLNPGKYRDNVSQTGAVYGDPEYDENIGGANEIHWWDLDHNDTVRITSDGFANFCGDFKYYLPSVVGKVDNINDFAQHNFTVDQLYGLTKLKGKDVFTFVAVNRNYRTYNVHRKEHKKKILNLSPGGDKMYSHMKHEVEKPDKKEYYEGLCSVVYALDLETDYNVVGGVGDYTEQWNKKHFRMRPLSYIMPSCLNDYYYKDLDTITNHYQQALFQRDEKGKYKDLYDVFSDGELGLNSGFKEFGWDISSLGKRLHLSGGRGGFNWLADIAMGQTQFGGYSLLGQSREYAYTPRKSKWLSFSNEWDGGNEGLSEANVDIDDKFVMHPFTTNDYKVSYGMITNPYNFAKALTRQRRIFANTHVMNSLLPKTSFNTGVNCVYLIGNYGEYITSDKWLEISNLYKDLDWIKNYGSNTQDSHGTLMYFPYNFTPQLKEYGKWTNRHFEAKQKGYMHSVSPTEVYKDFLTKPIYSKKRYKDESRDREEIHFIAGMSIGYRRIMKELQFYNNSNKMQQEEWTKPLMFYRKYKHNNFNWVVLGDYLKPRVPVADFSGLSIKDALQNLATIMDYDFGIKNGEPFFEESYQTVSPQTFYYSYDSEFDGQIVSQFVPVSQVLYKDAFLVPDVILDNLINGKYYFLKGEIIFISKENFDHAVFNTLVENDQMDSELQNNTRWAWTYRNVNNSVENIITLNMLPTTVPTQIIEENNIKRRKYAEDSLLFELKAIIDENNIIDIGEYGRTYDFQEFTDLHIHYDEDKVYKLKIQGSKDYKKVLRKDIPYVNSKDWIIYLGKKIIRNMNLSKYKINFNIKLIPSLKYGDYIAINNEYLKVGKNYINDVNYSNHKTYELYRVSSADHNLQDFTTTVSAYTVDTTAMNVKVNSGAVSSENIRSIGNS